MNSSKEHGCMNTDKYEERIVIIIEILGFKNFIKTKSAQEILDLFAEIEKEVREGKSIADERGNLLMLLPALTYFSDTIFVSLPKELLYPHSDFPTTIGQLPCLGHLRLIVSRIQNSILKHGLLTRGAISFGNMYHNGNKWFGQALNEAHEYESKYAIFPRIILTPSMIKEIENAIESDQKNKSYKTLYLCEDGFYSTDNLAWIHNALDNDYVTALAKLREMILLNLNDGKLLEGAKQKWRWLAQYFDKFVQNELHEQHKNRVNLVKS